ncbi:MAG TPA: hypothetical protein VF720_13200, partial [Candidatus Eisenbacteria bacterium]
MPRKISEPANPDPATLSRRCFEEFTDLAREAGAALHAAGQVRLGSPGPTGISGKVGEKGKEVERPELDWSWADSRGVLWVSCGCDDFEEGRLCAHLWALIVAMDERNLARLVPGKGPLEVLDDEAADEEEDGEATPAGPLIATRGRKPDNARWYRPSDPSATRVKPPGGWKHLVAGLDAPPQPRSSYVPQPVKAPSPIGPVWYLLNEQATRSSGQLVIEFHRIAATRRATESPLKPLPLGRADLAALTDAADKDILTILMGADPDYDDPSAAAREGDPQRHARLGVPGPLLSAIVPRLAATGRFGRPD